MNINISSDTERELKKLAAQNGKDVADFAGALLEERVREQKLLFDENVTDEDPTALSEAVARMTSRTPEEIAEAQARAVQAYKPEREPPPGQTLLDVVCGKWPGTETDEEVYEALKRLS